MSAKNSTNNVVTMKPKKLSPDQAIAKFKNDNYSRDDHERRIRRSYEQLLAAGFRPILLRQGVKYPTEDDWNEKPIHPVGDFVGYANIGIQTGEMGGFIADIDNDDEFITQEMLEWFLPPTPHKFGRYYGGQEQKLNHRLYKYTDREAAKYSKISNPTGTGAIELRTDGGQTMAPNSTIVDHERGYIIDSVRWEGGSIDMPAGPIGEISLVDLDLCRRVMYASVYAAANFKTDYYHEHVKFWCGFMVVAGVDDALLEKSVKWIVKESGQTDLQDRMALIKSTRAAFSKSGPSGVAGIGRLRESANWDNKFCTWLAKLMKSDVDAKDDGRPTVHVVHSRETHWQDLTLEAMIETEKFYQMAGQACIVTKAGSGGAGTGGGSAGGGLGGAGRAQIVALDKGTNAASWLSREIRFTQTTIDKATGVTTEQVIKCPTSLAVEIADPTTYKGALPELVGVSNIPIITREGRVIETAWGYDSELRTFFACEFPVQPMYREEALPVILDVLQDFPFSLGRYKAAALSALITAVVRPVLDICPLYVVTSSQPSDGKSVFSSMISSVVGMQPGTANSPLTRSGNDEEQEKQISSALARGKRVIVYDNHDGEFRSPCLAETLTSSCPEFRVLGKSEVRSVYNRSMFVLNGINTVPAEDLQTRCVFVNMDRVSTAGDRKFKYANVEDHVYANRNKIVSAVIALIKWAFEQPDGAWRANHRFKVWDYMVRRTVLLLTDKDVAPPLSEDEDRPISMREEAKNCFLLFLVVLWKNGMRSSKSKEGKWFRALDLAMNVVQDSEEEDWINILSKRRNSGLAEKCGFALSAIENGSVVDEEGVRWKLKKLSPRGMSAYRMEIVES